MRRNNTIYLMAICALMISIMLIFGFTPIGTISTGALTITLMGIPVAVMACTFGPLMGSFAGFIWGIISIAQAFLGMDATGVLILTSPNISAATKYGGLICMCIISRVLCGFLSGLIYDLVKIKDRRGFLSSLAGSAATSFFNTFFFMFFFCLFFYNMPEIQETYQPQNVFLFVFTIIGLNFVVEFLVNAIAGSAISFGVSEAARKMSVSCPLPRFFVKKEAE